MSGTRVTALAEFTQQEWGAITQYYTQSTSQLTDDKWDMILKATIALVPASKAHSILPTQEELDSELFPANERALVLD